MLVTDKGKPKKIPHKWVEVICCNILDRNIPADFADLKMMPMLMVCTPEKRSKPIIYEVSTNRVAVEVSIEVVAGHLWRFLNQIVDLKYSQFMLNMGQCEKVIKAWMHTRTHIIKIPKTVGFKSDPDIVLSRLNFVPDRVAKTLDELTKKAPFFAQILGRMHNHEAFCARIGSIYDLNSDRKQVVWMYGPTDGGKSLIDWMIRQLCGLSATRLTNEELSGRFWRSKLLEKRVCLVGEASAKFIRTSAFKDVTGEAQQSIERKGRDAFDADINTILFFSSNEPPRIPKDNSLANRIIPVHLDSIEPHRMLSEEAARACLERELPIIAGYCIQVWERVENSRIKYDNSALINLMEEWNEDITSILDKEFIEDKGSVLSHEQFTLKMREYGFSSKLDIDRAVRVLTSEYENVKSERKNLETEERGVFRKVKVYTNIRKRKPREKRYKI